MHITAPSRTRARRTPGEPEFWIFIFGDLAVFTLFFTVWSLERSRQPELFAWGHDHVNVTIGAINTLVLITSSAFVALGLEQLRRGSGWARQSFRAGVAMGGVFAVIKALEYTEHVRQGQLPSSNDFLMYYFVFTAIHLVHVLVGMGALLVISRRRAEPLTDLTSVESVCLYWHMVDLVWIFWFFLIYVL